MTSRIIDMHTHLWLGRLYESEEQLRHTADVYDLTRVLVSGLGSHLPDREEIAILNRAVYDLGRRDKRFGGYVYVSPSQEDALTVLRQGVEEYGFIGMKLWVSCLCDDERCDPLYEYCAEKDLPVLLHTFDKAAGQLRFESRARNVRRAALRHPGTRFIMAHLGGNCYQALPLIRELPNVWTDISGSVSRGDDLPYALEQLGTDRILFGSDGPGSFNTSYGQVLEATAGISREKLLWRNAAALFHLKEEDT